MGITTLLVVAIILLVFVWAIRSPIGGIVGYLIIYATYSSRTWYGYQLQSIFFRPPLLATAVLLMSCVINHDQLSWKISRKEIEIYLFSLTTFLISHLFGLGVTDSSSMYIEKMFKVSIFIFLLIRVVNSIEDFKIILWPFIAGSVFLSWQSHQIGGFSGGRLNNIGGADFSEANALAAFLIFSVILLGFKLFRSALWQKGLIIVCIALIFNTFIMTQSRAVFMGLFFGGCYVIVASPKKVKVQLFLYAIAGIFMLRILAPDNFWDRMYTIDDQAELISEDNSLINQNTELSRLDFWRTSIDIFKDHPMGIGAKNFGNVIPLYDPRNPGLDAHNTYVVCYTEIGVIGISLFLIIIFETFLQFRRIKQMSTLLTDSFDVQMLLLSLKSYFIVYITGPFVTHSYLYTEFTWIIFVLPICFEQVVKNKIRNSLEQ